jgi:hypothetical protein
MERADADQVRIRVRAGDKGAEGAGDEVRQKEKGKRKKEEGRRKPKAKSQKPKAKSQKPETALRARADRLLLQVF